MYLLVTVLYLHCHQDTAFVLFFTSPPLQQWYADKVLWCPSSANANYQDNYDSVNSWMTASAMCKVDFSPRRSRITVTRM